MSVTRVGAAIAELGVNTTAWFKGLGSAEKRLTRFGATLQVAGFRFSTMWMATIGAATAATVKWGMEHERAFANVKKTIDVSGPAATKYFAKLEQQLIDISKETPFATKELSDLARIGGQLGIQPEAIAKFTETIAKLGVAAAELPVEEAAVGLARIMAITGESQQNVDKLASTLAKLGDSFATNEARILNFSQRISGLANVSKITARDTLALGAAFTAVVPGVELIATQMSKAMAIFANAVQSGGDRLETLDKLVTHVGGNFKALWEKDAAAAIGALLKGLDNVDKVGGNAFVVLRELGLTNQRAAQAFLSAAGASDKFGKSLNIAREEWQKTGAEMKLNAEFSRVMETAWARLQIVLNKLRAVAIKVFSSFREVIDAAFDTMEGFIDTIEYAAGLLANLPGPVKTLIGVFIGLTGAIGPLTLGLGALFSTAASSVTGIKMLGNALKGLRGLFIAEAAAATTATAATNAFSFSMSVGAGKVGLVVKALGVLIVAVKALSALITGYLAYALTKAWIEFTGLRDEIDLVVESLYKLATGDFYGNKQAAAAGKRIESLANAYTRLAKAGKAEFIPFNKLMMKSESELNALMNKAIQGLQDKAGALRMTDAELKRHIGYVHQQKEDEKLLAKATELAGKKITDLVEAERIIKTARELGIDTIKGETDSLNELTESLSRNAAAMYKSVLPVKKVWETWQGFLAGIHGESFEKIADDLSKKPPFPFKPDIPIPTATAGGPVAHISDFPGIYTKVMEKTKEVREETNRWDDSVEHLADTFRILGITADSILGRMLGGIKGLVDGIEGFGDIDFGKIFSGGKGWFGELLSSAGIFGQIGASVLQIGKGIVSGFKSLFGGRDVGTVLDEVSRDMGVKVSEGLAKSILESGEPAQLAVAQIFQEGALSPDRFAQEIGDLFSYFERGEISKPQIVAALEESIPLLIENMAELGLAGEAEIQRIITAAERLGVEFDSLGQLIQGTFAPETMESIAESFNMSNEQVRQLAETLGVKVQTNLERMAANAGLTVDQFKGLADVVKKEYGVGMEDIAKLAEAMGVSVAELAESLGVKGVEGAEGLKDEQDLANDKLKLGADYADNLATALERAARASSGINIPVPSGQLPGLAEGGYIPPTPPHGQIFLAGEREGEYVIPESKLDEVAIGTGPRNVTISPTFNVNGVQNPEAFMQWLKLNHQGIVDEMIDALEREGAI